MTQQAPGLPELTLELLQSWLEQQDPTTPYNFMDTPNCLLTRFARAHGYIIEPGDYSTLFDHHEAHTCVREAELLSTVAVYNHTYGGALKYIKRLRNKALENLNAKA